jgi:cytochrome c-type biogenesis protein CcmE
MAKEKKNGNEKNQNPEKEPEKSEPTTGKKKRMSKKVVIAIAVIAIIIVLIVGLWGMQDNGTDYPTVSKIINNKSKHLDKEVEIRGTVKLDGYDPFNKTFILTDGDNDLLINYTGVLPSNFEEGKDVVVFGRLVQKAELEVEADEIVVGCASKY